MGSENSTVIDVARLAGVSIATVSRVINGTVPVSDHTKNRVLSSIAKLQFRPNENAARLGRIHRRARRRSENAAIERVIEQNLR
jgi:DNA-binding LacI/PurR family transcriptional regulator